MNLRTDVKALETRISKDYGGKEDLPYWLMTLDFGKAFAKMIRDWCGDCLRKLNTNIQEKNK